MCYILVLLQVCNDPYCMAGIRCIDVRALVVQQLWNKVYEYVEFVVIHVLIFGIFNVILHSKVWLTLLAWIVYELGLSYAVVPVYSDLCGTVT